MIFTLLKNHIKRNRSSRMKLSPKNITGILAISIVSLVILSLFGFILLQITETFYRLELTDVFLTSVIFILLIVLTIYEIVNIIKQLFNNDDNFIYMKLPIKKEAIFLSKIIYIYLRQLLVSFIFLGVTAGVYGIVSHMTITYYLRLTIIALILPLLPLSLASILSIPISYIIRVFKKNKKLLVTGLVLIVGIFFIGYISFVQVVLKFINLSSNQQGPVIDPQIIIELKQMTNNLKISSLFYEMLINDSFIINLLIVTSIISILAIGSYFILKYFYFNAIDNQNEKIVYSNKKDIKANKPLLSIFKKEFKTLSRNPNYAFQAIVMNLLMPIFIFFTIKLTDQAGRLAVGEEIVPGVTILTILIFILLSNSFQGTIISREKNAYYISKIIPVDPFKQILARISFGYLLSILMLALSILTITISGFISIFDGIFIFVMAIIFLFGYTFNAVYRDYKNPQLTSNEGGFDEGLNMYNTLLGGLIVAVGLGLINIALPYIIKLFPNMRKFKILGFIVIELTAKKVNIILYMIVFITIFTYATIGYFRLKKVVKNS